MYRKKVMVAFLVIYLIICSVRQTRGLEYYEFRLGAYANITFTQAIIEQSTISWEISSLDGDGPFCRDGILIPDALKPSQRGRFQIIASRTNSEFLATLQIRQIEQNDSGVYILSLDEGTQDNRISYTLDAYVDVLLPPGKATCKTGRSAYSDTLWLVGCSATLSSDGGGFIVCFQDGLKAPFMLLPERSATHISAKFWMRIMPNSPFHCCSYDVRDERDESSCTDFTFDPSSLQEQDPTTIDATTNDLGTAATPFDGGILITNLLAISPKYDKPSSVKEVQIPLPDATINEVMASRPVVILTVLSVYIMLFCVMYGLYFYHIKRNI